MVVPTPSGKSMDTAISWAVVIVPLITDVWVAAIVVLNLRFPEQAEKFGVRVEQWYVLVAFVLAALYIRLLFVPPVMTSG